jgi:hypothetical protein
MDKFFRDLWETLVGAEPVSRPKRPEASKRVVKVKRTIKRRAVSPMPDLTLEPAVALNSKISYSMRNHDKPSDKSPRLTGLEQLERNRKRRHTLKQGHALKQGYKAKATTN